MDLSEYLDSELIIIVPVLYILGIFIKKSVIDDRWIPIILGCMGITLATVSKFALHSPDSISDFADIIYGGITQGILCAASSVYANNIIKQMKGKKDDINDSESDNKDNNALR